ncbi:MAG TPA: amino acid adenylation domain-containing protein [Thermoanaerobaculia bacterium]|nr:amino acid adenylation domain-containing protein [Thermoanaerobaculia bacterium]
MASGQCLHQIFERRAEEFPRRVALSFGHRDLTYRELDDRAEGLAARLRDAGVGPEVLVGLAAERGFELIVGLLAILKAGGAYLPLDPAYPEARLRYLLADSRVRRVVTTADLGPRFAALGVEVLTADDAPGPAPPAAAGAGRPADDNLAYVIYTSGSTGEPKGVMVSHRNVVRLFEQADRHLHFGPEDVWSLCHSASFDFSVWEIWGALLYGGRLVIVPLEVARQPGRLCHLLAENGVTILSQTPSAFHGLLDAELHAETPFAPRLRALVFGGEALDPRLLAPWFERWGDQRPQVANLYGITETTVHVTWRRILREDLDGDAASPIGQPLGDLGVSLLDPRGFAVSAGTPGELHVTGPGLARGYLGRPGLTAERFLPAAGTGASGARAYRSGDRAVRGADGELRTLGRLDDQLKVRGFRIEPSEVEACLAAHPEVARAVVTSLDLGGGDVRLLAAVVPRPGSGLDGGAARLSQELRTRAARELPAHQVPAEVHVVGAIPLTAHGKVDRRALAALAGTAPPSAPGGPIGSTERTLLGLAAEVLRLPGLSPHDDLFDHGATSMAFVRLLRLTNDAFGVSLNGSELGDQATVARLAACVEAQLATAPPLFSETPHAGHPDAAEVLS